MADTTIEYLLKIRDEATPKIKAATSAVNEASDAEKKWIAQALASQSAEKARAEALGISTSQLRKMSAELVQQTEQAELVSAKFSHAGSQIEAAASAGRSSEQAFGKLGGATAKIAGALDLVDPRLGSVARGIADVADVGEVASGASGALGVSLASVAAIAGPVGIAVAALGAAYLVLKADLDEATAKADEMAAKATTWQTATEQWRGAVAGISDQWRVATGEITANQAAAEGQIAKLRESRQATQALYDAEVARLVALKDNNQATQADYEALQRAKEQRAAFAQGTDDLATKIELLADKKDLDTATTRKEADAQKALAAAQKQAAADAAAYAKALAGVHAQQAALDASTAALDTIIRASMGPEEQAAAAYRDRAAAIQKAIDAGADYQQIVAAQSASLQQYTADLRTATGAQTELAAAPTSGGANATTGAGAASTLSSVAGGASGVVSMIGNAGPIGAIVAAVIQLVDAIGDGLLTELHEWVLDLIDTIGELPTLIGDFISQTLADGPKAIAEMLPDLLANFIAMAVVELPKAIVLSMFQFFSTDFWKGVGQAFADAFAGLFSGGGDGADGRPRYNPRTSQAYATGTDYVTQTGMALIHQGERIVPATGASSGRTAGLMGGGGGSEVHVHLSGFAIGTPDQLVRELSRSLGTAGRGLSWPAGA